MITLFISFINLLTINRNVDLAFCDIKGNVKNPGVYLVEEGDIINDIILKAGGLKKNSYIKNINLSKKVTDEMVINILSISEYEDLTKECPVCKCEVPVCEEKETTTNVIETTTQKLTEKTTTQIITTTTTTTEKQELKVNINSASIDELVEIPGIGEATAKKIIEYRQSKKFESIEDILNVKGIGDKLFDKIKEYITI